jgi:SAM-dependent methyltransferase
VFGPQRHANLASALPVSEDGRVLDLGCGTGLTMAALCHRLGGNVRLVGVDAHAPKLVQALIGDPRVETVVADLNRPLPFRDAEAEAAVCFNVLECLPRKEAFLSEVARVLAPGGHLLLGHADFDTLVFNSSDIPLTRRLVHVFCDTTQGWMETSDGTMGRKLLGFARRSPFEVAETFAWVGIHTDFSEGSAAHLAVRGIAAAAHKHPELDERLGDWIADLEALAMRGEFLFSLNDYAVLLRKPNV